MSSEKYSSPSADNTEPIIDTVAEAEARDRSLIEYICDEASGILKRVDDKLVQHLIDRQSPHAHEITFYLELFDRLARDIYLRDASKPNPADVNNVYFGLIEQGRAFFEDLKLLGDESNRTMSVPDDGGFKAAHEVYETYRGAPNQITPMVAAKKLLVPSHDWAIDPDDEQNEALTRHLRQLDVYREVERLQITGLGLLDFPYSEQDVRAFLTTMPAIAFEGVTSIDFTCTPVTLEGSNTGEEQDAPYAIVGTHTHKFDENSAHITIYVEWFNQVYDALELDGDNDKVGVTLMRNSVNEVLAHEVGHALHTKLPVALLHDWNNAIAHEHEVGITDYVDSVRAQGDEQSHATERFAETFAMFYTKRGFGNDMTSVRTLIDVAPGHFEAMLTILRRTGAMDL